MDVYVNGCYEQVHIVDIYYKYEHTLPIVDALCNRAVELRHVDAGVWWYEGNSAVMSQKKRVLSPKSSPIPSIQCRSPICRPYLPKRASPTPSPTTIAKIKPIWNVLTEERNGR